VRKGSLIVAPLAAYAVPVGPTEPREKPVATFSVYPVEYKHVVPEPISLNSIADTFEVHCVFCLANRQDLVITEE